ncbi:hypothetical protein HU200_004943 [Digitaria exilis]|uniref:Uncharacterized protein n=1 Tax=Digitaria exilis TaxID=1010633 RepID=A0A835FU44_9POAL|nr:hypothetical protein HU200_004943 [Digitaria exilis]
MEPSDSNTGMEIQKAIRSPGCSSKRPPRDSIGGDSEIGRSTNQPTNKQRTNRNPLQLTATTRGSELDRARHPTERERRMTRATYRPRPSPPPVASGKRSTRGGAHGRTLRGDQRARRRLSPPLSSPRRSEGGVDFRIGFVWGGAEPRRDETKREGDAPCPCVSDFWGEFFYCQGGQVCRLYDAPTRRLLSTAGSGPRLFGLLDLAITHAPPLISRLVFAACLFLSRIEFPAHVHEISRPRRDPIRRHTNLKGSEFGVRPPLPSLPYQNPSPPPSSSERRARLPMATAAAAFTSSHLAPSISGRILRRRPAPRASAGSVTARARRLRCEFVAGGGNGALSGEEDPRLIDRVRSSLRLLFCCSPLVYRPSFSPLSSRCHLVEQVRRGPRGPLYICGVAKK